MTTCSMADIKPVGANGVTWGVKHFLAKKVSAVQADQGPACPAWPLAGPPHKTENRHESIK